MKKVFLILLVINFIAINTYSQITISKGPQFPVVKKVGYHNIIGADDKGFFVNQQSSVGKGISIAIEKYDNKTFKRIFSIKTQVEETQLGLDFNAASYPNFYYSSNKVFVFFHAYDKKAKEIICFLQTISNDGKASEVLQVAAYKFKAESDLVFWNRNFFKFIFSPDKNLFAVIPLYDDSDDYTCSLYQSSDFKKVNSKIVPPTYEGSKIIRENFAIDNSANLIFTVMFPHYKTEKKKEVRDGISSFGMGIIESKSNTVKISKLSIPDKKVLLDYNVSTLSNGDFILFGVICDKSEKNEEEVTIASASSFIKRVEGGTLKPVYEVINNFSDDSKKYLDETNMKLPAGESMKSSHFEYSEIVEMQGGVYLVTQYTKKARQIGSSFGPFILRSNKEIVVTKINEKGAMEWDRVIPKYHICPGMAEFAEKLPRYSGRYTICVIDNKINFVFLDHPKNINSTTNNFSIADLTPVKGTMGSELIIDKDTPSLVSVSIDATGKSTKQEILKFEENGSNYVSLDYKAFVDKNKLVVFLENRKAMNQQFGTINFK